MLNVLETRRIASPLVSQETLATTDYHPSNDGILHYESGLREMVQWVRQSRSAAPESESTRAFDLRTIAQCMIDVFTRFSGQGISEKPAALQRLRGALQSGDLESIGIAIEGLLSHLFCRQIFGSNSKLRSAFHLTVADLAVAASGADEDRSCSHSRRSRYLFLWGSVLLLLLGLFPSFRVLVPPKLLSQIHQLLIWTANQMQFAALYGRINSPILASTTTEFVSPALRESTTFRVETTQWAGFEGGSFLLFDIRELKEQNFRCFSELMALESRVKALQSQLTSLNSCLEAKEAVNRRLSKALVEKTDDDLDLVGVVVSIRRELKARESELRRLRDAQVTSAQTSLSSFSGHSDKSVQVTTSLQTPPSRNHSEDDPQSDKNDNQDRCPRSACNGGSRICSHAQKADSLQATVAALKRENEQRRVQGLRADAMISQLRKEMRVIKASADQSSQRYTALAAAQGVRDDCLTDRSLPSDTQRGFPQEKAKEGHPERGRATSQRAAPLPSEASAAQTAESEWRAKVAQLSDEVTVLKRMKAEADTARQEEVQRSRAREEKLQEEIGTLKGQLQASRRRESELTMLLSVQRSKAESEQALLAHLQETSTNLEKSNVENRFLKVKLEGVESQLSAARKEHADVVGRAAESERQLNLAVNSLERHRQDIRMKDAALREKTSLSLKLETDIEALRQRAARLEEELAHSVAGRENALQGRRAKEEENRGLASNLERSLNEVARLRTALGNAKKETLEAAKAAASANATVESLRAKCLQLQDDMRKAAADAALYRGEAERLRSGTEKESLSLRIEALKGLHEALVAQCAAQKGELVHLTKLRRQSGGASGATNALGGEREIAAVDVVEHFQREKQRDTERLTALTLQLADAELAYQELRRNANLQRNGRNASSSRRLKDETEVTSSSPWGPSANKPGQPRDSPSLYGKERAPEVRGLGGSMGQGVSSHALNGSGERNRAPALSAAPLSASHGLPHGVSYEAPRNSIGKENRGDFPPLLESPVAESPVPRMQRVAPRPTPAAELPSRPSAEQAPMWSANGMNRSGARGSHERPPQPALRSDSLRRMQLAQSARQTLPQAAAEDKVRKAPANNFGGQKSASNAFYF